MNGMCLKYLSIKGTQGLNYFATTNQLKDMLSFRTPW